MLGRYLISLIVSSCLLCIRSPWSTARRVSGHILVVDRLPDWAKKTAIGLLLAAVGALKFGFDALLVTFWAILF